MGITKAQQQMSHISNVQVKELFGMQDVMCHMQCHLAHGTKLGERTK